MENKIIFVDGVKVRKINDNFFAMSIKLDKFLEWAKGKETEHGYINLNLCQAKTSGVWYPKLNDWKPDKQKEAVKVEEQEEEIPF